MGWERTPEELCITGRTDDNLDFSGFIVVKYSQHRIHCFAVLAADVSAGDTTICILNFLLPNRIPFVL